MQLTQHTDLGLRLLIVLARADGGPLALPEFASQQDLSYHHVAKVAQTLGRAGFIVSQRGRAGGVSLARPSADITLGEVVRAVEKGMRLVDCSTCKLRHGCAASSIMARAMAAFLAVLDEATLAEAASTGVTHAPWALMRG